MSEDLPMLPPLTFQQKRVVGLGELVWDRLPQDDRLGGAPANFVLMAARLGDHGLLASRIGADSLGQRALDRLAELPIDLSYLQTDVEFPTGTVKVSLDHSEPGYEIVQPAAWDYLEFTHAWRELAQSADAVCFGTLAQRNSRSRTTIDAFLTCTPSRCARVFDVNLRGQFFDAEIVATSMPLTTILKMNEHEVSRVLDLLALPSPQGAKSSPATLQSAAQLLLRYFPALELVCITLGSSGSLLVSRHGHHRHPGLACAVADTVGAGDAFTAALVHYYLDGAPLAVLNEAGNRWGSWVASQPGGMPELDAQTLLGIAQTIKSVRR